MNVSTPRQPATPVAPTTVRSRVRRSPTAEQVLAAAEHLFAQGGSSALSVRRIAESLGCSRQIVYSRFRDKSDLIRALHAEGFRRLGAHFASVSTPLGSSDRVLALAGAYRSAALDSPALYGLMFGQPIAEFTPDSAARGVAMAAFRPVIEATEAWMLGLDPALDRQVTAAAAIDLWSISHGAVSIEIAGISDAGTVQRLERLITASMAAQERSLSGA